MPMYMLGSVPDPLNTEESKMDQKPWQCGDGTYVDRDREYIRNVYLCCWRHRIYGEGVQKWRKIEGLWGRHTCKDSGKDYVGKVYLCRGRQRIYGEGVQAVMETGRWREAESKWERPSRWGWSTHLERG